MRFQATFHLPVLSSTLCRSYFIRTERDIVDILQAFSSILEVQYPTKNVIVRLNRKLGTFETSPWNLSFSNDRKGILDDLPESEFKFN